MRKRGNSEAPANLSLFCTVALWERQEVEKEMRIFTKSPIETRCLARGCTGQPRALSQHSKLNMSYIDTYSCVFVPSLSGKYGVVKNLDVQ
jgi:hypothetical protein